REELGIEPESATRRLAAALGFVDFTSARVGLYAEQNGSLAFPAKGKEVSSEEADAGSPRIVLLPPTIVIEDPTVSRGTTALVNDVICGLSRCRSFTVVAPHTSLRIGDSGMEYENLQANLKINY